MLEEKICGIYCIENTLNHKRYIGQSVDIYNRWYTHKSKLNTNKHHSKHLQKAWNKYGEDFFDFYIIELCDEDFLNEKEIYWINYYNTYYDGYNETFGGEGYARQTRKIYQYSFNGDFIKEWDSVYELEKELGYKESTIRNACNNNEHCSAYGYQWSYEKLDNIGEYNTVTQKKHVYQYDKKGNFIKVYTSILSVEEDGFSYGNVGNCCKGIRQSCNGYVWSYTPLDKDDVINKFFHKKFKDNKYIKISFSKYSLDGIFIEYIDSLEYLKDNKYNIDMIIECCNGNKIQYKNFQWKYGFNTHNIEKVDRNISKKIPHKPRDNYRQAVICLTTNKKFKSFSDAEKYYELSHGALRNYFKNKAKYCGKLDSGEKLTWEKV